MLIKTVFNLKSGRKVEKLMQQEVENIAAIKELTNQYLDHEDSGTITVETHDGWEAFRFKDIESISIKITQ